MSQPEAPFTEGEERYLLAEIIKYSAIPPLVLLSLIRDAQTEIQWTEMALPYGRSLSACQRAFAALQQRMATDPQHAVYRRFSLGSAEIEQANASGRELMPRLPSYLSLSGSTSNVTGGLVTSNPELPPRKKRGRPNKEEFERRKAEAQARGEEYPKRRPKSAKTSTGSSAHPKKNLPQSPGYPDATDPQSETEMSPIGSTSVPSGGISLDSLLLPTSPVLPLPPPGNSPSASSGPSRTGYSVGIPSPETPSRPAPSSSAGVQAQLDPLTAQDPGSEAEPGGAQQSSRRPTVSGGPRVPYSKTSLSSPAENPYGL